MTTPSTASAQNAMAQTPEFTTRGVFTGAGAAAMTKVRGKGMTSPGNTRQGVGLYTLFFVDGGGQVADVTGLTHAAATVAPQTWKFVPGSYVRSTPTTAAQIQVECWQALTVSGAAGTPTSALADPPVGSLVAIQTTFFPNVVD